MTPKERLLQMKSYEEYEQGRGLLDGLKPDKEVIEHLSKLFGRLPSPHEELYRTPPLEQCKTCKNWQGFNGCRLYPQVLKGFPVKDGEEIPCQYREQRT